MEGSYLTQLNHFQQNAENRMEQAENTEICLKELCFQAISINPTSIREICYRVSRAGTINVIGFEDCKEFKKFPLDIRAI